MVHYQVFLKYSLKMKIIKVLVYLHGYHKWELVVIYMLKQLMEQMFQLLYLILHLNLKVLHLQH